MTPIETADHKMDWLPGLSNPSHSASNSVSPPRADFKTGLNTQTTDPNVDEVQFFIVCEDCGKHFWSRSKAVSHAALTAHVLIEEMMLSPAPVIIPESPTTGSASAPRLNTAATSALDADVGQEADAIDDFKDSEDGEDEDESICFDCGRHFWSQKAAHNHAMIGHVHGADVAPSSASSGSPWAATFAPGMSEQTTSRAFSPINSGHNGGVNQAAPGHHGYLNGTQTYKTNFNEHGFAAWSRKNVGGSAVPNVSQKRFARRPKRSADDFISPNLMHLTPRLVVFAAAPQGSLRAHPYPVCFHQRIFHAPSSQAPRQILLLVQPLRRPQAPATRQ